MHLRFLYISFFLLLLLSQLYSQPEKIVIGDKHIIQSKILSEEREYWISLPDSYTENSYKQYPVIILLDGNTHFKSTSGMISFMSSGNTDKREIPEMIVVAVLNVNRERDFTPDKIITKRENKTGGGDNFLTFLEDELIPEIDKEYRTMPYRILIGHSLGGLITVHAYMKDSSSFNSFISIDPSFGTWDNEVMDKKIDSVDQSIFSKPLYLATANWGKRNLRNRDRHIRYFESLNKKCQGFLDVKQTYYEDKNHSSVPFPAIYDGLSFIFRDYSYQYLEANDVNDLVLHFSDFSKRHSFDFKPSEELVNRIGYRFLRSSNPEVKMKSLDFFKLNTENYPESYNFFDSLGEAQFALDNTQDAIMSFEKSLNLNSGNENARKMIEQIENQ